MTLIMIALASLAFGACTGSNQTSQTRTAARQATPASKFEADLKYAREGRFIHIYVVKRQDGGAFTREDIAYLKANTHPETNYWLLSDEKRSVIAGTNFDWTPENMAALNKKFVIEDRTTE